MNSLRQIDIIDKMADLCERVSEVSILGQVNFFFFDGSDDSFGVAVLLGVSDFRHRDADLGRL